MGAAEESPGVASSIAPLDVLLHVLDLETLDDSLFRGKTPPTRLVRIFGGQVAGQALMAAHRTVPDRVVHSLHAYFLRRGDISAPVIYNVDAIRDGRSYVTRRVLAIQGGRPIFNLQASFKVPEPGYEWQQSMPAGVTLPEDLPSWDGYDWRRGDDEVEDPRPGPSFPFELRKAPPVGGYERLVWFRTLGDLPDDATLHCCVAAYASDLTLLSIPIERYASHAALEGRTVQPPGFVASLDHAMWFHRPFRMDDWMLYASSSPSSGDGRALCQGQMFTHDGKLAITVMQEGAIRPPRPE
jgi:acyl-CoA thioesterase II